MDGNQLEVGKQKKTSARVHRILKKRDPQLIESTKRCVVMKGHKTNQMVNEILQDFTKLLKPNCVSLIRKNEILPFEDVNSLEFLMQKNNCSCFLLGSHTKKRPCNIIMVRIILLIHQMNNNLLLYFNLGPNV
jgi:hypothetical protein